MRQTIDKYKPTLRKEILEALYDSAESMTKTEGVKGFIDSVLTESEKTIIGRRILIAKFTLAGFSQPEIHERLQGVSPNTFGRIYKWLNEQFPGYDAALRQSKKEEQQRADKRRKPRPEYVDPFSLRGLKRRFPLHFLLFNLVDKPKK